MRHAVKHRKGPGQHRGGAPAGFDLDGVEWTAEGKIRRVEKIQYYTKYGFIPSPDSVVYDLGFGHQVIELAGPSNAHKS